MKQRCYSSNQWIEQIFESQQAKKGGIVRRKWNSVRRFASQAELVAAVKDKGFHIILNGDQYVIFCNKADIRIIL
jgi:hypothetical protein